MIDQDLMYKMQDFFTTLYRGITEPNQYVYLRAGTEFNSTNARTIPLEVSDRNTPTEMAQYAAKLSDKGLHVWHNINPVNIKPDLYHRGTADQVSYQVACFVDIDILSPAHKSKNLAVDFDEAKSFLPFEPSLLIDSGHGLQAYFLFDKPIKITNENRAECQKRAKLLIEVVRQKANGKDIDGVGDLSRVLRTPYTFNYKLGVDNAPMCHVVDCSKKKFTPAEFDKKLNDLYTPPVKKLQETHKQSKNAANVSISNPLADNAEYNQFRTRKMLDCIPCASQTYSDWVAIGMILKNNGNDLSDWVQWSRADDRFKDGECDSKWLGFDTNGALTIATLHKFARDLFNYSEKDTQREWYQLHTELNNRRAKISTGDSALDEQLNLWQKQNEWQINSETVDALIDAKKFVDSLTGENFTAAVATDNANLSKIALLRFYADTFTAEFFTLCKKADGVETSNVRKRISKLVTQLERDQKNEQRQYNRKMADIAHKKAVEARAKQITDDRNELDILRDQEQSPERDKQIISLICNACDWRKSIHGDRIAIKPTADNLNLIFTYDPVIDGLFSYDEFNGEIVLTKQPKWRKSPCIGDTWTDSDDAELRLYLRTIYTEFANTQLVYDAIVSYAHKREFNKVKDFYRNLPKWDGKKRAEELFIKFLRVDDTPYSREVTLNILTGCIARAFYPGCDYQYSLILSGKQGIGKSYIAERLGKLYGGYGVLIDSVADSHAIDVIKTLHIVEIQEMNAFTRADANAIKSFIGRNADNYRAPYERRAIPIKRHCVFIITTNGQHYLIDTTGNRRFIVLECGSQEREFIEGLTDDYIRQLWAEVYQHYQELFKDGFDANKLLLSKESQNIAASIAEAHTKNDIVEDIQSFIDKKIPPQPIWKLLSKAERREFCEKGSVIIDNGAEALKARISSYAKSKKHETQWLADFQSLSNDKTVIIKVTGKYTANDGYLIKGTEYRQHISPTEIYHEAFAATDRRKSIQTIAATLDKLDGWHKGNRLQKTDPEYYDQKIVYYRNDNNIPDDDVDDAQDNSADTQDTAKTTENYHLQGEPVAPDDVAFDID